MQIIRGDYPGTPAGSCIYRDFDVPEAYITGADMAAGNLPEFPLDGKLKVRDLSFDTETWEPAVVPDTVRLSGHEVTVDVDLSEAQVHCSVEIILADIRRDLILSQVESCRPDGVLNLEGTFIGRDLYLCKVNLRSFPAGVKIDGLEVGGNIYLDDAVLARQFELARVGRGIYVPTATAAAMLHV